MQHSQIPHKFHTSYANIEAKSHQNQSTHPGVNTVVQCIECVFRLKVCRCTAVRIQMAKGRKLLGSGTKGFLATKSRPKTVRFIGFHSEK